MLISFVTGPFNLLEVHDSGKGVLWKGCVDLKSVGKRAQKWDKYIKEWWWHLTIQIDRQCLDALLKCPCFSNWVNDSEAGLGGLW